MDNPLTPNKINKLINLAEDKSFSRHRRMLVNTYDAKRSLGQQALVQTSVNYETSSGILDLEGVEGFGESAAGLSVTESLRQSSTFNAGEITGRSTGTEDVGPSKVPMGRYTLAIDNITDQMDKQTNEIQDIMRYSIATEFTVHSKRNLTEDETSFINREAPIPIQQTTRTQFPDSLASSTNVSDIASYFNQVKCSDLGVVHSDSPDRYSAMPSITEVSTTSPIEISEQSPPLQTYTIDESLDSVPVRQPRLEKMPEKLNLNSSSMTKNYDKQTFYPTKAEQNKNNDNNFKVPNVSLIPKASGKNVPTGYIPNPIASSSLASHSAYLASSSKPTDVLIRNLQASMRMVNADDDTDCSGENSLSISKIADYLGKESNISVTGILQLNRKNKKQPLSEVQMNMQETQREKVHVTNLSDTRKLETASTTGTMSTVVSMDKLKISEKQVIPTLVVSQNSHNEDNEGLQDKKRSTRSKSPSSKSHSTLSTVHENFISFKSSGSSPLHNSRGEANNTHVRSPNVEYRELDKSVDWREVLQQKRLLQEGLEEKWADISSSSANGFVGVSCPVTIKLTTLSDSWLTARLQFDNLPNGGKDLTIELPRLPLLLSPGKSEHFTVHITSYVEMKTALSYTIFLKDASIDGEILQLGELDVNIKMPTVQAMSCDGVNKLTFPPIQEKCSLIKSFVLISDCPVDLQLELSVVARENIFAIKAVQEVRKSDVSKVLMDRRGPTEDGQGKSKEMSKQLCRLSSGNAIRVVIKFNAPKLTDLQTEESVVTFNGALNVNLFGVNSVLRKVDLSGLVGTVNLAVKMPSNKLLLTNEITNLTVCNTGSLPGVWVVKFANPLSDNFSFKVAPTKFDIRPGAMRQVTLCYTGPEDTVSETTLIFEDVTAGNKTAIEIIGSSDQPKTFPIRTNHNIMSWIRSERKELSLKNSTNQKIQIRCYTVGEGFYIDLPGMEARGVYCLTFSPNECRSLPVVFNPASNLPYSAMLHLVYDKNSDFSRKIKLFGSSSGECMRWTGLVTYGETALVRAISREPITLELYNKSTMSAFVCARVHFNLQYASVAATAVLSGGGRVVCARSRHALSLQVSWARVERRARLARTAALATLTVLTGAELTRRRILRIIRDEATGVLDTSCLDDHLKVLANQFNGEDPNMDNMLAGFSETKDSLNELIGGLHELTAQIVLPQDFADENTIIITDDTVVEHHTLCD